jgi:hypothetical protein
VGEFRMEDLERDLSVVPEVPGEVHRSHTPAPELALELVAVPESLVQGVGYGHEAAGWKDQQNVYHTFG